MWVPGSLTGADGGHTGRELKGELELPGVRLYQEQRSECAKACVRGREIDLRSCSEGLSRAWPRTMLQKSETRGQESESAKKWETIL